MIVNIKQHIDMATTSQEQKLMTKPLEQKFTLIPEVKTINRETIEKGNEYGGGDKYCFFLRNINFDLNRSGEDWLNIISDKMNLVGEEWNGWSDINQMRRALKRLNKLAKVAQISWGYGIKGVKGRTAIWREISNNINIKGLYTHLDNGKSYDTNLTKDIWDDEFPVQTCSLEDYEKDEVLSVEILKDQICDTCKGQKLIRCSNCEGSGREQYIDGYFASGEERIKTGTCHECYGKGQIPCPDCEGSGLAGGNGIVSNIQLYKEHFISRPYGFLLTPWFFSYNSDGQLHKEDLILKYNKKNAILFDKHDELKHDILSKTGSNYSPLVEYLYDSMEETNQNNNTVELFLRIDQIFRVICLEYYINDKHFVFYIFETDDHKCIISWNHWYFPVISLFGKVKYWGVEEDED